MRQAGLTDLRVADLIRDVRILDRARRDADGRDTAVKVLRDSGGEAIAPAMAFSYGRRLPFTVRRVREKRPCRRSCRQAPRPNSKPHLIAAP